MCAMWVRPWRRRGGRLTTSRRRKKDKEVGTVEGRMKPKNKRDKKNACCYLNPQQSIQPLPNGWAIVLAIDDVPQRGWLPVGGNCFALNDRSALPRKQTALCE